MLTITLGVLVTPLVYEVSLLSAAQWQAMSGSVPQVKTPVLDSIAKGWAWALDDIREFQRTRIRTFVWKQVYMFPFIIVWTGIAVALLRKC